MAANNPRPPIAPPSEPGYKGPPQVKPAPPPAPPSPVTQWSVIRDSISQMLNLLADELDAAPRQGAEHDEPEGTRYIVISDTFAHQLAERLRRVVPQAPQNRVVREGELSKR